MNKRRKISRTLLILLLSSTILAGCSPKVESTEETKSKDEIGNSSQMSTNLQLTDDNSTIPTSGKLSIENSTGYTEDEYNLIISLKTDEYEKLSVKEFNNYISENMYGQSDSSNYLESYSKVYENISKEDENYSFVRYTLELTNGEIYSEQFNENPIFVYFCFSKMRESGVDTIDGGMRYDFSFLAPSNIYYTITDQSDITVGERDKLFIEYANNLQGIIDKMSEENLLKEDIKKTIQAEFDSISQEISNDKITFKCEIADIETYNNPIQ